MRETVKDWRDEWINTNGETDELEVVLRDVNLPEFQNTLYEGSFVEIPAELYIKKVVQVAKIIDSSILDRIGAYDLTLR